MLLIPVFSLSQEEYEKIRKSDPEYKKDFEDFQEGMQIEFFAFLDSTNKAYTDFIHESENEFSELLKESFSEYRALLIQKQAGNVKPVNIPVFQITPQERTSSELHERSVKSSESNEVIFSPLNAEFHSPSLKVTFQFLGSELSLDYDERMKQLPEILKADAESVAKSYDFLRNTDYMHVIKQLGEICRSWNLNDWDYFCLVNNFSRSIYSNKNEQKIITWFLMQESNFKVKIGYFQDCAEVLFATSEVVYDVPWFSVNGERYFAFDYPHNSINTYDIEYFKGYKYLNIFHEKPLLLEEQKEDKTLTFTFQGRTCNLNLSYDRKYVDYYSSYPAIAAEYYFALPVSLTFKESVERNILPELQGKSSFEALHFLLSMVQYGFDYKTDAVHFGREKYMVPDEILFYGFSDCDDRSIIFSHLVKDLLDRDVIALDFNGHICTGVEVRDPSEGGNLVHDGRKYLVCDPTYTGAIPGLVMPPFQIKDAVVIDFNKHLGLYERRKEIWDHANGEGLLQAENSSNVIIHEDGSSFLTGMILSDSVSESDSGNITAEETKAFVARLDTNHRIQWLKRMEGSNQNFGCCISEYNKEFLYVFGFFRDNITLDDFHLSGRKEGDFFLARLDHSGEAKWLRRIEIPDDSLHQVLNIVCDPDGSLKYCDADEYFPHDNNYVMEVDEKGNCYIAALLKGKSSGIESSRWYAEGGGFDIIAYLVNGNDNLLKHNYPKSVSLLFTLIQFLNNNGSVIEGSSLLKTIATLYSNSIKDFPGPYSEVGKISQIGNNNGIAWLKTIDKKPVTISQFRAQHESRLKLSYVNGNAKLDVLNGVKTGGDNIWNDVNYILLDKTTGEIRFEFDNQYRKKMPVHSQLL